MSDPSTNPYSSDPDRVVPNPDDPLDPGVEDPLDPDIEDPLNPYDPEVPVQDPDLDPDDPNAELSGGDPAAGSVR